VTQAVLLDVDGTLIDSNDAHARAWVDAFAEAGMQVPFARIRPLIGMGGDRILPIVDPSLSEDQPPGKTIAERRGEIFFERYLATIRATPGARALLEAIRAHGARVVIASSAKARELDALLAQGGDLAPLVDVASTKDDAGSSKPAPDIVSAALAKADVGADDAVMVGDTQYDVEAAHKAHVACIALRCGGNDPATLADAQALYEDPAELAAALDAPPFAWSTACSSAR